MPEAVLDGTRRARLVIPRRPKLDRRGNRSAEDLPAKRKETSPVELVVDIDFACPRFAVWERWVLTLRVTPDLLFAIERSSSCCSVLCLN